MAAMAVGGSDVAVVDMFYGVRLERFGVAVAYY